MVTATVPSLLSGVCAAASASVIAPDSMRDSSWSSAESICAGPGCCGSGVETSWEGMAGACGVSVEVAAGVDAAAGDAAADFDAARVSVGAACGVAGESLP